MGLPYGDSVGVAISQPRVEVRSASTLGKYIIMFSYSVRVAISRRRYHGGIAACVIPTIYRYGKEIR